MSAEILDNDHQGEGPVEDRPTIGGRESLEVPTGVVDPFDAGTPQVGEAQYGSFRDFLSAIETSGTAGNFPPEILEKIRTEAAEETA